MTNLIFLGNGLLADYARSALAPHFNIIFHARTAADLATVKELKAKNPTLPAVLASFGVLIKKDLLDLFEPAGIINLHPSLLPKYRGASPIETALKNGDTTLGISIMKLVREMDAGPVYYQQSFDFTTLLDPHQIADATEIKTTIYKTLAEAGAAWLIQHLENLPAPREQSGTPTFSTKFDKSMSLLTPDLATLSAGHFATSAKTATELHREIIAHALYPRSKIALNGHETLILASHIPNPGENPILTITAKDSQILSLDRVQPAGRKPMDALSFKNGYLK